MYQRDTLFQTIPQHPGFPHLANIGIVFCIDDPSQSFLFNMAENTANSLTGM